MKRRHTASRSRRPTAKFMLKDNLDQFEIISTSFALRLEAARSERRG